MPIQQSKLDTLLFKSLYILAAGVVAAQTMGFEDLTSLLFLLTFPLTVLLWLRSIRKVVTGMDLLVIGIAALTVLNVLINASLTNTSPSFSYIKKAIMFVTTLLFLQTMHRIRFDWDIIRFSSLIVDILTVFLIGMYFIQGTQVFMLNGRISRYLTFRFSNPNLTGMVLTCLYMLELYRLFAPEKWYLKLLHIMMAAFLALFIMQTQSRNCLGVLALFTVVCAVLVFRGRKNMCIGKLWAAFITVLPLVFVGLYFLLVYTRWVQEALSFLVEEGKSLDSRMKIWIPALENLFASPLIGAYSQISKGSGASQMHNTHLDVACSYGIPVLILVCVLLYKYLHQDGRVYKSKEGFIYILGFACAIMLGIGEAALFSGGLGLYIFVGSFLLMANHAEKESGDIL